MAAGLLLIIMMREGTCLMVNVKPYAYHYNTKSVILKKTEKTNEFFRVMKGDCYNGSDHR